jgi:CBS domain-containing protein
MTSLAHQSIAMVMRRPRVVALPHLHLSEVFHTMQQNNIQHLPVVDDHLRLLGMLTERDTCLAMFRDPRRPGAPTIFADVSAGDLMVLAEPIHSSDSIEDAISRMVGRGLTCLPVVDNIGRLIGLVTRTDLLNALRLPPLPLEYVEAHP